jgi:hypothetical protein
MQETTAVDTAPRDLRTVEQFSEKFPAWSPASLRSLILGAQDRIDSRGRRILGNDFGVAIFRDRRRVLISESRFFEWIAAQQKRRAA